MTEGAAAEDDEADEVVSGGASVVGVVEGVSDDEVVELEGGGVDDSLVVLDEEEGGGVELDELEDEGGRETEEDEEGLALEDDDDGVAEDDDEGRYTISLCSPPNSNGPLTTVLDDDVVGLGSSKDSIRPPSPCRRCAAGYLTSQLGTA